MGGSMGQDGSMGQGESLEARVGRVRAQLRQGRALAALGWGELLRALLVLGLCAHPRLQRDPEARLRARGVRPLLAVPMEGEGPRGQREPWRDGNCEAALRCVALAAAAGPEPAMQLKLTALLSPRLCVSGGGFGIRGAGLGPRPLSRAPPPQAPALPWLSPEENEALGRGLGRLQRVAQAAVAQGVQVLVDAELAHLNPALTCLTCGLMWRHNRAGPRPWVWHTWQAYLRDTEVLLHAHLGTPGYERCLRLLLAELARPGSRLSLMVATHNEESALAALRGSGNAAGGFPVYQSVPLGAPEGGVPYLARRAAENRGGGGGARRQRQLLAAELRRRLWPWG
uniref:hydroxyproline dehydrogenase-like n=1 Tax=Lonchura striata TaxID=40157 RepID=UPI001293F8B9|nr:hydroxyproline dehydrogenase-like [Lonchura striata domestica]